MRIDSSLRQPGRRRARRRAQASIVQLFVLVLALLPAAPVHGLVPAAGNVSGIADGVGGRTSRTLGYDGLDRLTGASAPQLWGTGSFSYDPLDGLRTAALGSRVYNYGYDAAERLSAVTDGGGAPVLGLGYDTRGRVVQRNGVVLGFDLGERLGSLGAESYRYDASGRRVRTQRADGTRRYTQYDRTGVLRYALETGSGEVTQYVPFGGSLTALRIGAAGTVRYVHSDALGSPVAVSDVSGGLLGRLEYEPYGAWWSGSAALTGQVGYTGHEQAPLGGLVYAQARYYEPIAGRFLSPDPVGVDLRSGQNYDRYGYAHDNPYAFTDPDGRNPLLKLGVDFGIELGIQYLTTGEVDLTAAALDTLAGAINPLRTLERARDLGRIVGASGKAARGTTVIGRFNKATGNIDGTRAGENSLLKHLPNQGSPKANWHQNAGVLRQEMNKGLPIRDTAVNPRTGELIDYSGSFLNAERNLLRDRGWTYDPATTLWSPP